MNSKTLYTSIGRFAPSYDRFLELTGYGKSVEHFVEKTAQEVNGSIRRVLDAGCGTGWYVDALLRKFPSAEAYAFDREEGMIRRLEENMRRRKCDHRVHAFTGDITGPPKEILGMTFDLIITSGVLEHVPLESTVATLSEHLEPGGYFLNSPICNTWYGRMIGTVYGCEPYPEDRNIEAFCGQGLELVKVFQPKRILGSFKEAHLFQKEE